MKGSYNILNGILAFALTIGALTVAYKKAFPSNAGQPREAKTEQISGREAYLPLTFLVTTLLEENASVKQ